MSTKKYLLYTDDGLLIEKFNRIFSSRQLTVQPADCFPDSDRNFQLIILDGDALPPSYSLGKIKKFKRNKIPVVYIFSALSGKEVMEVLKHGVVSVIFKDYSPQWIKSELRDVLFNFNYLERVKEITENNNRTKKFLNVVNSLTSDNDINKIMNDILSAMTEVFHLKCTSFYIVKKGKLEQKIVLGKGLPEKTLQGWNMTDTQLKWLCRLQKEHEPIYVTAKSPQGYREFFPVNTLVVPLVIKQKFFGLITATLPRDSAKLTTNEIALLRAFAEQTAVALENAKLYWDVIRAREELIRQEKKALLNQTIISLNHEINNPLSIISMEAQLLQQRLEKNENKIESRIAKIETNIDRIKQILEKISNLNVEDHIPVDYAGSQKMLNLYDH